jgi:hypothetical protein
VPSEVGVRADHVAPSDARHRADVFWIESDSNSPIGPRRVIKARYVNPGAPEDRVFDAN